MTRDSSVKSTFFPDDRPQESGFELTYPGLAQSAGLADGSFHIAAQLTNAYAATTLWPTPQPPHASFVYLERARIIAAQQMQISDPGLQDALIQLAHLARLCPPCGFKLLMRLEVSALIEK